MTVKSLPEVAKKVKMVISSCPHCQATVIHESYFYPFDKRIKIYWCGVCHWYWCQPFHKEWVMAGDIRQFEAGTGIVFSTERGE